MSISDKRVWLYDNGSPVWASVICTGKASHATVPGTYKVVAKLKDWISTIYHVPMPFYLRLDRGSFGLHAGIIAVNPASHGCIRLPSEYAEALFNRVEVGTPVIIVP